MLALPGALGRRAPHWAIRFPTMKASILLYVAARPLSVLTEAITDHLRLHLSRRVVRERFSIHTAEYIDAPEDVVEKVSAALRLIRQVSARRYRRMIHDLRRILVSDVGTSSYSFVTKMCILDLQIVRKKSYGYVALILVHEATHARLYHAGIPTWQSIQGRVERLCVREQIAFASELGEVGWGGAAEMIGALERALAVPWWTEARQFETRLRVITDSDLPRWLIRAWAWWHQPRTTGRK